MVLGLECPSCAAKIEAFLPWVMFAVPASGLEVTLVKKSRLDLHAGKFSEPLDNAHALGAALRVKRARSRQCPVISGIGAFFRARHRRLSWLPLELRADGLGTGRANARTGVAHGILDPGDLAAARPRTGGANG